MIDNFEVGDTMKVTWVSSGVTPSALIGDIVSGSETVVDSFTMSSSGNGHYYGFYTITTEGYGVARTVATIGGLPFKRSIKFRGIAVEVD